MMDVEIGDIIETSNGLVGEVTAKLTNTVIVDISAMENFNELEIEHEKQVVRYTDIKQIQTVK
jgi:uncharacterized protein YkvS